MNKLLYLIRHGQATEKSSYQPDKERDLTQTGSQEAKLIAMKLIDRKLTPEIIYTSSAERAIQTANVVAHTVSLDRTMVHHEDSLYDASTRTFFQFITQLSDDQKKVCCVGHNPVISYLAEYLTKAEIGDMATGSCAIIQFDISKWMEVSQGAGTLVDYVTPGSTTE